MAFLRYTALRFLVFAVVAALLWLIGLRGFWLLLFAFLLSGIVSIFALNRARDALSASLVNRQERIKQRLAERTAAEDAWNDEIRQADDERVTDGPPGEPSDDGRTGEPSSERSGDGRPGYDASGS